MQKMINFDEVTDENITKENQHWLDILDHPFRILIIDGSGKANALLNLISHQSDIDKTYLYDKDPYEANING